MQRRMQEQRSILDFVIDDARSMQKRIGGKDRTKLDEYLTSVREIEMRIQKAERFGKTPDPAVETPAGIPTSYTEYVGVMYDLLLLAFQTDQTRVAAFCLSHDGSNRSFSEIGIVEGHHDLSHHQNNAERIEKVAKIDRWYVEQFAKFLKKMNEQKDLDGKSLLHNSMIVYGGGNADANRHTHDDLPILLAGSGGGNLTPGRHIKHGGKPMCNLFLSMSERMGVRDLSAFGDSTGKRNGPRADIRPLVGIHSVKAAATSDLTVAFHGADLEKLISRRFSTPNGVKASASTSAVPQTQIMPSSGSMPMARS